MEEQKKFKIGDIVELKSGGAGMTIERINHHPQHGEMAYCVWQEKNKPYGKNYPTAVLKHIDTSDGVDIMML